MKIDYDELEQLLTDMDIPYSPTEIHAMITGMTVAGALEFEWINLFSKIISVEITKNTNFVTRMEQLKNHINKQLQDYNSFNFNLLLPLTDSVFILADYLSEWANSFLLGISFVQTNYQKEKGDIGEAINDIEMICQLGYSFDDDQDELNQAIEDIIEHLRTITALLYQHYVSDTTITSNNQQQRLH